MKGTNREGEAAIKNSKFSIEGQGLVTQTYKLEDILVLCSASPASVVIDEHHFVSIEEPLPYD